MDQPIHTSVLPGFRFVPGAPTERLSFTIGLRSFPMKTLFGAALGALLLSASAMAATPGSPGSVTPQGSAVLAVVSTPYTAHASGSEQMPVFDYTAPAGEPADPVVVSASQFPGASAKLPVFSYRGAVPVNGSAGGTAGQNSRLFPSTTYLVNQTGGGR